MLPLSVLSSPSPLLALWLFHSHKILMKLSNKPNKWVWSQPEPRLTGPSLDNRFVKFFKSWPFPVDPELYRFLLRLPISNSDPMTVSTTEIFDKLLMESLLKSLPTWRHKLPTLNKPFVVDPRRNLPLIWTLNNQDLAQEGTWHSQNYPTSKYNCFGKPLSLRDAIIWYQIQNKLRQPFRWDEIKTFFKKIQALFLKYFAFVMEPLIQLMRHDFWMHNFF